MMGMTIEQQVQHLAVTMARMEGKLDASLELKKEVMDVKADVKATNDSLDSTDDVAKEALQRSKQNEKDIAGLITTVKWGIGIVITIMMPIALFALSYMTGGQ